jgi:hypothetical protein
VAGNSNPWKMKGLEKSLSLFSRFSLFSFGGQEGGGAVPVEHRQSLHAEARKAGPQEIPALPPPRRALYPMVRGRRHPGASWPENSD